MSATTPASTPLVLAHDLAKTFDVSAPWLNRVLEGKPRTLLHAVDGVSFDIEKGKTLALVGESGCGKSTVARLLVGLYEPTRGGLTFDGQDAHAAFKGSNAKSMRRRIQMIFQDPYASLNPRWLVEDIIGEPLKEHGLITDKAQLKERVGELLQSVGLSPLDMVKYPHQFSGGMRQRVVIALALAAEPQLIVADEPTTALDVSIQAQIITLLKSICKSRGAAVMLITHDMGVIAETCDRVAVLYAGRVVEIGPVHEVINHPAHPYTAGLMASIPDMAQDRERLNQIDGAMPRLNAIPPGCAFNPRCPRRFDRCTTERPELLEAGATRAACWLHAPEVAA